MISPLQCTMYNHYDKVKFGNVIHVFKIYNLVLNEAS